MIVATTTHHVLSGCVEFLLKEFTMRETHNAYLYWPIVR